MDDSLAVLKDALKNYIDGAAAQKSDDPPDLRPIFAELDEAEKQALPFAPPRLKHFLEGKSYKKAYQFLCGGTPEKGSCS
ncbi:MAG: hypothetical protein AAGA18_07325 [Verrucomicrobiota bacterium]